MRYCRRVGINWLVTNCYSWQHHNTERPSAPSQVETPYLRWAQVARVPVGPVLAGSGYCNRNEMSPLVSRYGSC